MPLISPLLEARLRRHWQVTLAVTLAVLFSLGHQVFFRVVADRYDRAIHRATDLGLAVDPSRPLAVTPPRLLVVLAANMLPANVADVGRESGALAASMLEELTQSTHRHGMQVVVAEPGLTSQESNAVQIRAHLRILCTYPQFVSFKLGDGSSEFGLYPREALAADAGVAPEGSGFTGVTFHFIVSSNKEVDEMIGQAQRAGAKVVKPAQASQWGGYFGYFSDPDGYLWKVAAPAAR